MSVDINKSVLELLSEIDGKIDQVSEDVEEVEFITSCIELCLFEIDKVTK